MNVCMCVVSSMTAYVWGRVQEVCVCECVYVCCVVLWRRVREEGLGGVCICVNVCVCLCGVAVEGTQGRFRRCVCVC